MKDVCYNVYIAVNVGFFGESQGFSSTAKWLSGSNAI